MGHSRRLCPFVLNELETQRGWPRRCTTEAQDRHAAQNGNSSDRRWILLEGDIMFDGKNNRLLDSMYFRLLLTTGGFLVWFGASYLLLSLS